MSRVKQSPLVAAWSTVCQSLRCNVSPLAVALLSICAASSTVTHAQTYTRTESITYADDLNGWVLGQVARRAVNGVEVERTEFTARMQPQRIFSFSKAQADQTVSYYADGKPATIADGQGNTTSLSGWSFGIPQRIENADGTFQTARVDSVDGWIRDVVNEAGSKTCYDYDSMGRIREIRFTAESAVGTCGADWNLTTVAFEPVASVEHGVPAGHWRRTEQAGNARKISYYDALWRPIVEEAFDVAQVGETHSWVAKRYDIDGQPTFVSYPRNPTQVGAINWDVASQGHHTAYDALGRPTSVQQDSEHARLATTIEYLPGLMRKTTNPRNQSTIERFQSFDVPSFEHPTQVDAPEGTRTTIVRDVFGKPQSMTRGSSN